jgi:ribosomal protein S18 acetylase RimI-like enzyme
MSEHVPIEVRSLNLVSGPDLATAQRIVRECELAAVGWTDSTPEMVTSQLTNPIAWRDVHRLALVDGVAEGLLVAEARDDAREVFLDAYAIGGRADEIRRLLLSFGLEVAGERAGRDVEASHDPIDDPLELSAAFWQVMTASYTQHTAYAAVIESLGFAPVRRFWRMVCDLQGATGVEPVAPVGVTRRSVASEADARLLHRLFHESFSEHFGHTVDEAYESWIARVRASPGNREDGWWIADLDGEPVAMCIVDDSQAEADEGYVRTLGVLSSARGRGIGRWLLQCAAADAVRHGRTAIALAVDGANTTGATALYESVGYRVRQEIDVYCYPLVERALSKKVSPQA